ncbi:MAG: hypothetical protein KF901_12200 [Myxococcales bacterium]|nr:hypothetical protein [Myxococcales bacterium]
MGERVGVTMQASAPGKMMVSGEYAVLEGAPAIVMAAQTRGVVRLEGSPRALEHVAAGLEAPTPRYPEAAHARRQAERRLGVVPGALVVDVSALRRDGQKLGLGSSAATAAASAALVHAWHGRDLDDPRVRDEVFEDAYLGHMSVAPQGSGADVAAAVLGGVVRFQRGAYASATSGAPSDEASMALTSATQVADTAPTPAQVTDTAPISAQPKTAPTSARAGGALTRAGSSGEAARTAPLVWPAGLIVRVAWTGQAASTAALVAQVKALAASSPARHRAAMDALAAEAEAFVVAFAQDARAVVEAAGRYHDAMAALGAAAGAPIVEARLEQVAALAAATGGRAKPSGAGGGDVALAFFAGDEDAAAFAARCAREGVEVLALELGGPGARVDRVD